MSIRTSCSMAACNNSLSPLWISLLLCIGMAFLCRLCCALTLTLEPDTLCHNGAGKDGSSSPVDCSPTLDAVLEGMASNTTVYLSPGNYTVRSSYTVENKSDVSIVGVPSDPGSVIIECDDSYGLVFISIQRLHITGLTVRDCGFKDKRKVKDIFTYIKSFIVLFFEPLLDFSTGIFVVDCQDMILENVTITENEGYGLVGINIIGESRFSHVNVIENTPMECITSLAESPEPGGSGGGMFLLYQDYQNDSATEYSHFSSFLFEYGHIERNFNCRLDLFAVQYNKLSRSLAPMLSQNNSFIGSGGVTLNLAQSLYAMNATFINSNISNNSGLYHTGGMEISQFEITSDTHVYIKNVDFYKNGGHFHGDIRFGSNSLDPGGALVASFYAPLPPQFFTSKLLSKLILQHESSISIIGCTFHENVAQSGSGVSVVSFGPVIGFVQDRMLIQDCIFSNNQGDYGSALFITEISYSAFEPGLIMVLDSLEVVGNRKLDASASDRTSVIAVNYVNVSFTGSNYFHHNMETALSVYSGIVTVFGKINFTSNVGTNGGGLRLSTESYLVLTGQANLMFKENRGLVSGGAIHVNFDTVRSNRYDCFLFIDEIDIFCNIFDNCPMPRNRFNVSFIDNVAPFGSAIFGSSFSSCPWNTNNEGLYFLTSNDTLDGVWLNSNASQLPLLFYPPYDSSNFIINTLAEFIRNEEEMRNQSNELNMQVTPGQMFTQRLGAFDQLDQPVPLTIFSQIGGSSNIQAHSQLGGSNRFLLSGGMQEFLDVPVHVFGEQNTTYDLTITSYEALVNLNMKVHLMSCSDGFVFNYTTLTCDCEIDNYLSDVSCTDNGMVMYSENNWIGRDENNSYIQAECILDFCKPNVVLVNFTSRDQDQCREGRSGVLCGECIKGYSRKIGSTECSDCKNNAFLSLVLVFAVLGILLFVILAIFDITVTDGYINGFIFYANIMGVYMSNFVPVTEDAGYPPRVLIAFMNLNFGIETCFYDGATELGLAGLQLLFPVYLMSILLVVTLCANYIPFTNISCLLQKINVTHIFATLILYSYTNISKTCIAILSVVKVEGVSPSPARWLRDPNVLYGLQLHLFLVFVSLFFIIILLPLPIFLLFPKLSFRAPYVQKLKPLIDAFIAPFDTGKTFWISFRLIFRLLIFLIGAFGASTAQLVTMACLIALLTILQAYIKPFRTSSRNFIDMVVMVNLTLFSVVVIYLHSKILSNEQEVMNILLAFTYAFTVMLLILFIHYLLIRFDCTRVPYEKTFAFIREKLRQSVNVFNIKKHRERRKKTLDNKRQANLGVTHTSIILSQHDRECERNFTALREVLLEDPPTGRKGPQSKDPEIPVE